MPNESNGHFHARRKTVEHVTHCCVTTRCCILQRSNDTSVSHVRSESRGIATLTKAVQASMRQCAANKFEFLTFPNMLPECDVPRIRSNRQTTVRRGRRVSSHVSNDFLFLLHPTGTCDAMFREASTFWELWCLPAVCTPSRTVDARTFRKVYFPELSNISSLMPPQS